MGLTLAIGIATGCVYSLVAVGYSLIYRTTGVVNFSQGSYVMVGGFATWWFFAEAGLPYPLAIAAGIAAAMLLGLALWTIVVLPLWWRRSAPYVVLLATIVFGAIVADRSLRWRRFAWSGQRPYRPLHLIQLPDSNRLRHLARAARRTPEGDRRPALGRSSAVSGTGGSS